jgi:hypothetical protein
MKIIKKSGAYLTWKDPNNTYDFNVSGKQALKKHFIENPEALNALKPYLMPSRDNSEMDNTLEALEAIGIANLSDEEKEQLKDIRKLKGLSTNDLELSAAELADLAELDGFGEEEETEEQD